MSAKAADVSLAFSHVSVIATTSRLLVVTKSEKDADFWRIDLDTKIYSAGHFVNWLPLKMFLCWIKISKKNTENVYSDTNIPIVRGL